MDENKRFSIYFEADGTDDAKAVFKAMEDVFKANPSKTFVLNCEDNCSTIAIR